MTMMFVPTPSFLSEPVGVVPAACAVWVGAITAPLGRETTLPSTTSGFGLAQTERGKVRTSIDSADPEVHAGDEASLTRVQCVPVTRITADG